MKLYLNNLIIITSSFLMISCSSISDLDISSIIDKTENWLFYEEDQSGTEVSTNNEENILEENLDVEEVFPDINDIPQVKPEFEQIDEEFFDSEENKEEGIETNNNTNVSKISKKNNTNNATDIKKKKNIIAVFEVRQNIRFKLTKMLLESDPPVDSKQPVVDNLFDIENATKVAIIQFPDNSIIPDNTADKVLLEIVKFKDSKKLRLVGHASKTGSETISGKRKNMEISISRAETIKNMLVNKGFDSTKIEIFGKGDLEPLKEEVEKFGEAVNRRVEVFFISD
tara:strand:+ start:206 stop:1057 length:852 start_codon:yes stop_codon:yes gene_type:complete